MTDQAFTDEQKQYLQGFAAGVDLSRHAQGLPGLNGALAALPVLNNSADGSAAGTTVTVGGDIHAHAQDRFLAEGKKLSAEEQAKRDKNALDMWDELNERADAGAFPKGTDVFMTKFHGLFYVAPAQDGYMCRLRLPAGVMTSHQFRGVADLAAQFGGGYTHVTTRANLQIREIGAGDAVNVLTGLQDLGIVIRGSGADNIRNITASPTAGIDTQELIDTRSLAKQLHHYILNHREMYGLPRKFNVAFDGGGRVSALADTNDIGLMAVRVDGEPYFRLELGGITGHKDFSRDTGVMLKPDQVIPAVAAIIRTFVDHGDRTDRRKARLKYLLDDWGFDRFLDEAKQHLPFDWPRVPLDTCEQRGGVDPLGHVGVHRQKQDGLNYIGVVLPVGKLTCEQMCALASISERFGGGDIRLTVWQNLLITDVADADVESACREIESIGLHHAAANVRAGLVACTGNAGCKFAASDTKSHAMAIADHIEQHVELDQPVNIHLTGCDHSCAQHYIGDIGLLGANVDRSDDMVEGYHVYVGGGFGPRQAIGRELRRDVPADEAPQLVERVLRGYLKHRRDADERFSEFTNRHEIDQLLGLIDADQPAAVN